MNKTGLILINGRQEKLAYGTSVRQKKNHLFRYTGYNFSSIAMVTFMVTKK